jgi:hypothetical protein
MTLALMVLVAAVGAWEAQNADSDPFDACGGTSGGTKVGAVTSVLHSSVSVGRRYTGAPCDLFAGDVLQTDSRGEAVLRLGIGDRQTSCAIFQNAGLTIYPDLPKPVIKPVITPVITFSRGRTWCSTAGRDKSSFLVLRTRLRVHNARFGVEVDPRTNKVLIKVAYGTVEIPGKTVKTVEKNRAVLVLQTGAIEGPQPAPFDATDALAWSRLR